MPSFRHAAATLVDRAILLASAAGVTASAVLSAWGATFIPGSLPRPAESLAKGLLLTLVGASVPHVLRMQALGIESADYSGCPRWLRGASYALMLAGGVLFFLPAVLMFCGIGPAVDGSTLPSTVPGGFGLLAFTGIFSQTWSRIAKTAAAAAA